MKPEISISVVSLADQEEIIAYVLKTRKELFPMLNHQNIPTDLQYFSRTYRENVLGTFLQARTTGGKIVGTIGMMEYDHRFPNFSFLTNRVVEVARLYVDPTFRKCGIGKALVEEIKKIGRKRGVDLFYLHTHPFLTGAYEFWLKQGFDLLQSCEESGFETVHMANGAVRTVKLHQTDSLMTNHAL